MIIHGLFSFFTSIFERKGTNKQGSDEINSLLWWNFCQNSFSFVMQRPISICKFWQRRQSQWSHCAVTDISKPPQFFLSHADALLTHVSQSQNIEKFKFKLSYFKLLKCRPIRSETFWSKSTRCYRISVMPFRCKKLGDISMFCARPKF